MRKMEQQMVEAIRNNATDKTFGNTRVHAIIGGHEVQLHGNIIAHVDASRGAVRFTLAGWPTPTTRSRLNALLSEFGPELSGVTQYRGRQMYGTPGNWRDITATEWVQS